MTKGQKQGLIALLLAITAAILLVVEREQPQADMQYFAHQGRIFGTYYNIRYEATTNLEADIQAALQEFDNSLSMFNEQSTLSRINRHETQQTDIYFDSMYAVANEVYAISEGAFDITVAPLVNLWGFGLKNRADVTADQVNTLLPLVGMDKVQVINQCCYLPEGMMLDCGAIAKGQACDVIAARLKDNGCTNYLVDIGGEVVAKGLNSHGEPWKIGITKPEDDTTGIKNNIHRVVESTNIAMATSGNYRNFYYDGEQKRSHTIDPRTGYPVSHTLLSATVVSGSCMRADAFATACMVLGPAQAIQMIEQTTNTECYLIIAEADTLRTITSSGWNL